VIILLSFLIVILSKNMTLLWPLKIMIIFHNSVLRLRSKTRKKGPRRPREKRKEGPAAAGARRLAGAPRAGRGEGGSVYLFLTLFRALSPRGRCSTSRLLYPCPGLAAVHGLLHPGHPRSTPAHTDGPVAPFSGPESEVLGGFVARKKLL
jgi:hypothetical protein